MIFIELTVIFAEADIADLGVPMPGFPAFWLIATDNDAESHIWKCEIMISLYLCYNNINDSVNATMNVDLSGLNAIYPHYLCISSIYKYKTCIIRL